MRAELCELREQPRGVSLTVDRPKAERRCVARQVTKQYPLPFRPDENHARLAVMLRLVALRPIKPNFRGSVDVAGTEHTDLGGPYARESLQTHHIGYDWWEMQQGRLDDQIVHGTTGAISRALVRPCLSPATMLSASGIDAEINSSAAAHLNIRRTRSMFLLICFRE